MDINNLFCNNYLHVLLYKWCSAEAVWGTRGEKTCTERGPHQKNPQICQWTEKNITKTALVPADQAERRLQPKLLKKKKQNKVETGPQHFQEPT